jgi:hypothetical protein
MAGDALFGTGTSDQLTSISDDDLNLVNQLRRLFRDAKAAKTRNYSRWHRNYRLINNQMGSPSANTWQPLPRDSEIFPTVSALVAWMTDQYVLIDAVPYADPHSPFYNFISQLALDLSDVMYSTWYVEDYDAQIKLMLWDAFAYGTGIAKTVWDQSVDAGFGNAMLRRVDPYSFFPDPNATCMEDAEYFVEVRKMTFTELERRYPNSAALIRSGYGDDTDPAIDKRPTLNAEQGSGNSPVARLPTDSVTGMGGATNLARPKRATSSPTSSNPRVTVYEFWCKETEFEEADYSDLPEPDQPVLAEAFAESSWHVYVMANGHILLDEKADEIYPSGNHPYERYVFDDIGEFYGIALVDHLAFPQIYINRLLTALEQNAELTGNPVFLDPANSNLARVGVVNRPGQRLPVSPAGMNTGGGPRWLVPPPMPSQVMDLVNFWISRIENTSGLSAIVKGATPTARNSEGVMSSIQEAAFVRIRSGLRNLEKTLERCAVKIADLIVHNYTEQRIMAIIGPQGAQTAKVFQARHFYGPTTKGASPLKFMIQITAGASAPTSRQAREAEADTLFAMGGIDRETLLEAHQYPHIPLILARIKQGMADGTFGPPAPRQSSGRSS